MNRISRIAIGILLAASTLYFAAIGVEASHQLVNQHRRSDDCRTPRHIGLAYEAINYDVASDDRLMSETDPGACTAQAAPAGDALVAVDGIRIAGWYIPAANGIGPAGPTVILSHGWTGNKSGQLAEALLFHDAWNVVLFDFRNHGQSQDAPTTQGIHEQRDLRAVFDWVVRTKRADEIVLWGQSMGGHAAVNVAADDSRVDGLILDVTHPSLLIPMANRIEEDWPFGQVGALATIVGTWIRTGVNVVGDDPIDAIDDLGERPVLLIAAGADDTMDVRHHEAMRDRAMGGGVDVRLEVCAGAEHHLVIDTCPDDYERWVTRFLAEHRLGERR